MVRRLFLVVIAGAWLVLANSAQADLVGLWRFDADVSPQPDATGNGHVGNLQGDVKWANDADRGGVMEFDGDADYLEVDDSDLLSIEGDLTIVAWANFVSFDNWNSIVAKTGEFQLNFPGPFDVYTARQGDGRVSLYLGDGAAVIRQNLSDLPPEAEVWQHIAVTYDNDDGTVIHYLNGEENGVGFNDAPLVDNDTSVFIGSRADFVTHMFGRLDDVGIFNEVLSPEDLQLVMAGDFSKWLGGLAGDFNNDKLVNDVDINLLSQEVRTGGMNPVFDANKDGKVDEADRSHWVEKIVNTWLGDSNLDKEFNTTDLVQVFQRGKYEDGVAANAGWGDGDWNGDAEFDTGDLVVAFQAGGFEKGPRPPAAAVPEPGSFALLILGLVGLVRAMRR